MDDTVDLFWVVALALVGWLLWRRLRPGHTIPAAARGPVPLPPHQDADEEAAVGYVTAACNLGAQSQGAGGSADGVCRTFANLAPVKTVATDIYDSATAVFEGCNHRIQGECVSDEAFCIRTVWPLRWEGATEEQIAFLSGHLDCSGVPEEAAKAYWRARGANV